MNLYAAASIKSFFKPCLYWATQSGLVEHGADMTPELLLHLLPIHRIPFGKETDKMSNSSSKISTWLNRGVKFADVAHKSIVSIMIVGCILGTVNIGVGFYQTYSILKDREKEREQIIAARKLEASTDSDTSKNGN